MRRSERKVRTRAALKDAGRAFYGAGRGGEATVAAIAARAGVAEGTFYLYFDNKDALIDELVSDINRELLSELLAEVAAHLETDLRTMVAGLCDRYVRFFVEHISYLDIFAQYLARHAETSLRRQFTAEETMGWVDRTLGRALAVTDPFVRRLLATALGGIWRNAGMMAAAEPDRRDEIATFLSETTLMFLRSRRPGIDEVSLVELVVNPPP